MIRWGLVTAGMTLLFLSPWLLLYLPDYIHSSFASPPHIKDIVIPYDRPLNLLSVLPLFYSSTPLHYTFLCLAIAIVAGGAILYKTEKLTIFPAKLATSGGTIIAAYLLFIQTSPLVSGFETSIRYSIPILIAGTPLILSLVYLWAVGNKNIRFSPLFTVIAPILGTIIIFSFYPSFAVRIRQAYQNGSILAFSSNAVKSKFIEYSNRVINGDVKQRVISAQEQVPAGQPLLAWLSTPFYLDYRRNTVYDAERSGIATPWASIPDANYFLIQYEVPPVRTLGVYLHPKPGKREIYISKKCIAFLQFYQQLPKTTDAIYDDGKILVFRKRNPLSGQDTQPLK
jgi:hypothetical protein